MKTFPFSCNGTLPITRTGRDDLPDTQPMMPFMVALGRMAAEALVSSGWK